MSMSQDLVARNVILVLLVCWFSIVSQNVGLAESSNSNAAAPIKSAAAPPYRPTAEYHQREMRGWRLMVAPDLLEDEKLANAVFAELERQLAAIEQVVPAGPLEKIRQVVIWVEKYESHHPCMAYHPDRNWLLEHDMNPDKARSVEIANARNFIRWTREQPWMVLHELAHGYHHRFLPGGYRNKEIREAFERASREGKYESVAYVRGGEKRAYALNNPMEFFAENSEAFFGKNDFFPFTRADLEKFDPETFALLQKLWKVTEESTQERENAATR